jgi:serine/threonine protein kinase
MQFYDHGDFMEHAYLLMELISTDLEDLKKQANTQRIALKSVFMIGLQVVDRLEALHRIGYLHRDVKPDNLAIGLSEKSKVIYLFDFGLAHPIGAERPQEEKGKVVGTLGFMSCRAH